MGFSPCKLLLIVSSPNTVECWICFALSINSTEDDDAVAVHFHPESCDLLLPAPKEATP